MSTYFMRKQCYVVPIHTSALIGADKKLRPNSDYAGKLLMNVREIDILLAEDSNDDSELASRALWREHLASNMFIARDGEEALDFMFCRGLFAERSFNSPPKLVLLDVKLPKVSGIDVLKHLKDDSRTKAIPVVILASSKEELDLARSYDLGANSYIQKPAGVAGSRQMVKTVGLYWMDINRGPVAKGAPGSARTAAL
jgi:CheY-like chemotaxis protein